MNPTPQDILALIVTDELGLVLRGEACVYITPEEINDDMRPTDHAEFLVNGYYPLAQQLGADVLKTTLERALAAICVDALGVYCAHQCYYIQINKEHWKKSPFAIDRQQLPHILGLAFLTHTAGLHQLEIKPGDAQHDAAYKIVLAGMQLLARDHGIDWGIPLPSL